MPSSLPQVLKTLELEWRTGSLFVGQQLDDHTRHIVGGHLTAQALVAAAQSAPEGRELRSVHTQFVKAGDPSESVEFEVVVLQDGGKQSTRRVSARQGDRVLMEALISLAIPAEEDEFFVPVVPSVANADESPILDRMDGILGVDWFERRGTEHADPDREAVWWRPDGGVEVDRVVATALSAHFMAAMPIAPVMSAKMAEGQHLMAMVHFSAWFHRTPDVLGWNLVEQGSASGANARGLAQGKMFSPTGDLLITTTQELLFTRRR